MITRRTSKGKGGPLTPHLQEGVVEWQTRVDINNLDVQVERYS
jgi:hypothetical protein